MHLEPRKMIDRVQSLRHESEEAGTDTEEVWKLLNDCEKAFKELIPEPTIVYVQDGAVFRVIIPPGAPDVLVRDYDVMDDDGLPRDGDGTAYSEELWPA